MYATQACTAVSCYVKTCQSAYSAICGMVGVCGAFALLTQHLQHCQQTGSSNSSIFSNPLYAHALEQVCIKMLL